jgi:hypothetical protein
LVKRAQPLKRSGTRFLPFVLTDFRSYNLHGRFMLEIGAPVSVRGRDRISATEPGRTPDPAKIVSAAVPSEDLSEEELSELLMRKLEEME